MTAQKPRHPLCTTLTLLIAANQRKATDLEFEIHEVIAKLAYLAEWSDEKKADLYARLAETVKREDRIVEIERKVSFAMWQNDQFTFV
ncbi:hypothetical protein UFOVP60_43 [uncultured Caudovirales phage]|uniref:Uncharacterized protein n=1 Tax=uncultured Caudovirales phage TaxID=2100421 RepID=A0A6J5T9G2_9CAUD|nr:hypothetical protein UFOVP60_43 [uncultured Caudovirales phage]